MANEYRNFVNLTQPQIAESDKAATPLYQPHLDPLNVEMGSYNDAGHFNFSQDLINSLGPRNAPAHARGSTQSKFAHLPHDAISQPAHPGQRAKRQPGYTFVSWIDNAPGLNQFNSRLSNFSMPSQTPEQHKRQVLQPLMDSSLASAMGSLSMEEE